MRYYVLCLFWAEIMILFGYFWMVTVDLCAAHSLFCTFHHLFFCIHFSIIVRLINILFLQWRERERSQKKKQSFVIAAHDLICIYLVCSANHPFTYKPTNKLTKQKKNMKENRAQNEWKAGCMMAVFFRRMPLRFYHL